MGVTTFSGPIRAGTIQNTTGDTLGKIKNVGFVEMAQSATITQVDTLTAYNTGIVIPAYSRISNIQFLVTTGWAATATVSVGTSATATELVVGQTLAAVGQVIAGPGTDATRTGNWVDVGASDVIIYILSGASGAPVGVGDINVRYLQAVNA
jgi:hypothetical protein